MTGGPPALLLLGGLAVAWNQRYLDAATRRGLAVLVVDAPTGHLPALLADWRGGPYAAAAPAEVAAIGAGRHAAIVDRAYDWSRRYDLRGVCCLREDYVLAAALVADLLGLPSPGLRAAQVCRDKHLQRRYLAEWSPLSRAVAPDARDAAAVAWSRFPAVVKPVGRLASSGVTEVADTDQLCAALRGYRPDERLLLEERAAGPEFSVESLSDRGEIRYLEVTAKRTTEHHSRYFVELGHTTPADALAPEDRRWLARTHAEVLRRLDFRTGMAHAEYRQVPGQAPTLIEIAARPPGDSIMALHWLATGAPLEDAVVGLCLGEEVSHPAARRFARQVYLTHEPGTFRRLRVDPALGVPAAGFDPATVRPQVAECGAAQDPAAVRCVVALKPPGTELGPVRESADRAAMFVVDAATPARLDAIEARCRAAIAVEVTPPGSAWAGDLAAADGPTTAGAVVAAGGPTTADGTAAETLR